MAALPDAGRQGGRRSLATDHRGGLPLLRDGGTPAGWHGIYALVYRQDAQGGLPPCAGGAALLPGDAHAGVPDGAVPPRRDVPALGHAIPCCGSLISCMETPWCPPVARCRSGACHCLPWHL